MGDEVFSCDHLCHASMPLEHIDAKATSMKSAEWIRALAAVATLCCGC